MKKILLIDDEDNPMRFYARALQVLGFEVLHCHTVDEARKVLEEDKPLNGIILDVMMPPGEFFKREDTEKGTATGVLLYGCIRKRRPTIPILVLTNVTAPETLEAFPQGQAVRLLRKIEYPPFELAHFVQNWLEQQSSPE